MGTDWSGNGWAEDAITACRPAPVRRQTRYGVVDLDGDVLLRGEFGTVRMSAVELSRTHLLVLGRWRLARDQAVTVELTIDGQDVFALATIAYAEACGADAICVLKLEASTPSGNDLIAAVVDGVQRRAA